MGGILDLGALVVAAAMAGENLGAVDDAHLVRVGQHGEQALHLGVGDRVVVEIEAHIGRLADLDGDALEQRIGIVWQRQQARRLGREGCAHAQRGLLGTRPVGRRTRAPGCGLGIEIVEIGEAAGGEEAVAHIADSALDATLLVAARHRYRTRLEAIVRSECDQRRMEADGVALSLQHRALQVVVEQDPGTAVQASNAATWPRRKLSMRASRKKRRKIRRE